MKRLILIFLFLSHFGFAEDTQKRRVPRNREDEKVEPIDYKYSYTLCVCSIFKDEAPYLKEWIEYHRMLGVDHFRLYNNDSTDNYLEILKPYIDKNLVTLIEWPSNPNGLGPKEEWVVTTQLPALSDGINFFKGISKWVALIDTDEFILPSLPHIDIISFLEEYDSYAGVLINWQNFGTSELWDIPKDKLMIESLTLKAKEQSVYNYPVKSIVKPDQVNLEVPVWCPHTWAYSSSQHHLILCNHHKWRFGMVDITKARINHYVHRSERVFYEHKIPNKERMKGEKLTQTYIKDWKDSCNQVEDTEILRFVPQLTRIILSASE